MVPLNEDVSAFCDFDGSERPSFVTRDVNQWDKVRLLSAFGEAGRHGLVDRALASGGLARGFESWLWQGGSFGSFLLLLSPCGLSLSLSE